MDNTMISAAPLTGDSLKFGERMPVQSNDLEDMDANSESSSGNSSDSDDGSVETNSSLSTDSDETEESKIFEQAQITNEILQLPRDLCEYSVIFREFFTEELWSQLDPEQRMRLQSKLPDFSKLLEPAEAMAEQQHTVKLLFQNKLERFGHSPLVDLHRNLETGNYRPDIKALRRSIIKSQRREQRFRECEHVGRMAKKLFIARERFLRNAYNSAPDEVSYFEKTLQKHQNQHSLLFNTDTKICAVRARKRFYAEISEIKKQINLLPSDSLLSADEEDKEDDSLSYLTQDINAEEMVVLKSAATFASSTDKCIFDTFFQRRRDYSDEEAMRLSQYAKRPKLSNRNFKQYLMDYKRKKLTEPNLPEYETADIRLRDVCARAQIGGSFKRSFPLGQKPGRKPKPKSNEPPALVPIAQAEKPALKKFNQNLMKQQKFDQNNMQNRTNVRVLNSNAITDSNTMGAFNIYDRDGLEMQQEEVETSISAYVANNEANAVGMMPKTNFKTTTPNDARALPKLEPIIQRLPNNSNQIKDKTNASSVINLKQALPAVVQATNYVATTVGSGSSELIQETHSCFFALIRDFFCATTNHRMKFDELKQRIQTWLNNPITALNDWYAQASNWSSLLASAIKFLAGDYIEQPEDYVPYIEYKTHLNIYQWIGAGRDTDARLKLLCNYWLEHRKDLHVSKPPISPLQIQLQQQQQLKAQNSNDFPAATSINMLSLSTSATATTTTTNTLSGNLNSALVPAPPPRFPTKWTVRAATTDEIIEFRRQERERFEQPHRAYTYRMHGYESVVAPVRGIYSPQSLALTKARGHSMMVDERPNFVTILTLVRDATARLPNGEGTRADISELLKSSQYINPHVAENVMQTIVSGALDRLHTESDACVRYDSKRKIWIYLHRNRSESEFELMHQKQQAQPKLGKLTKTTATIPPSIVDTPATGAILNSTRKMIPKGVIKTLPIKDGISTKIAMPALVPSNSALISAQTAAQTTQATLNKPTQVVLPKSTLPVPPLKYNIPPTAVATNTLLQQQKSLLKPAVQHQQNQRRFIDSKTGATLITTTGVTQKTVQSINAAGNTIGYSLPTGKFVSIATTNTSTTFNAITASASAATSMATKATATTPLTATVAGKRVSLSKPIIINQINSKNPQQQQQTLINQNKLKTAQIIKTTQQQQQQQQTQGYIIPISAANSNIQMQLQQHWVKGTSSTQQVTAVSPTITNSKQMSNVQTIVVEPTAVAASNEVAKLASNNIIRFVPNSKQQQQIISNKIVGQRLIATTNSGNNQNIINKSNVTIRGATKILTTTLNTNNQTTANVTTTNPSQESTSTTVLPNNSTIVSTSSNLPGTIIKMSPQTFTALQQKQQIQHIVKTISPTSAQQTKQQMQPQQRQQRLIIGNTAIIAHSGGNNATTKKIVLQQQQQQSPIQSTAKVGTTNTIITHTKPTNAIPNPTAGSNKIQMLNATSLTPQQQRILLQNLKQQQQQQSNNASKPLTVVVSQSPGGVTRLLKTSTAVSALSPKTGSTTDTITTPTITKTIVTGSKAPGQIISLNTTANAGNNETGGTIITPNVAVSQSQRNVITIGGTTQQRLISTQASTNNATSAIRVIQSGSGGAATSTNTGPTTFSIANIQGKQVVFATKTSANLKQITNIGQTTSGTAGNSVIINGQTIKLQGNNLQAITKTSGGGNVSNASNVSKSQATPQLQTVIMGNQILRVLPQNLIPAKAVVRSEATNTIQNRIVTVGQSSSSNRVSTATTSINSMPKTIVFGSGLVGSNNSGTQTIRLQSSSGTASTQEPTQTTSQKTTTTSGNRVVLAVPGGGQFLLPSNFAPGGGTINLKSLQNMKLVSLAQVQQQQDKSKNNTTTATTLAKT